MWSKFITAHVSCLPEGNWIALKGLICGKLPVPPSQSITHSNAIYIPPYTLAAGFLYSCSVLFSFMQMTLRFVWQHTEVIDLPVKCSAGGCQRLSGAWGSRWALSAGEKFPEKKNCVTYFLKFYSLTSWGASNHTHTQKLFWWWCHCRGFSNNEQQD